MSYEGNSEIYRINPGDGARRRRGSPTTRPSTARPSFSPDGSQIAFVSNRQGSPQIFVMPATGGGGAKRVTFQGKYNQTPRWNPRADKPQIAFTGRDERGVFDIFILDVKTGQDRPRHAGPGLEPGSRPGRPTGACWPTSRRRGGLFVSNPETHHEVADLARQRVVAVLGPGAAALRRRVSAATSVRDHRHRHQHDVAAGGARRRRAGRVEVLDERAEITRLGRGIGTDGGWAAQGIDAHAGVLRDYARDRARARRAHRRRRHRGAAARAERARLPRCPPREILGVPVEVIDGEREAALTFRAVAASFPAETGERIAWR